MKRLRVLFILVILSLVFSCQQRPDVSISLAVDPPLPTTDSTVTVNLSSSLDIGITMAKISINGQTVVNGDKLPLTYSWKPSKADTYLLEGYVENIFGQNGTDQRIVKVIDQTAPDVKEIKVLPAFPEANSSIYLSVMAEDNESDVIKVVAKVANNLVEAQTIDRPIILELPQLSEGEYPLNVVVSTGDFSKTSTSTELRVYPVDSGPPSVEVNFQKSFFSTEDNVILNLQISDDTEISSVTIECDGVESYNETFTGVNSINLSVNLGKFDVGHHSALISVKDVRGKSTIESGVFAVGIGPANIELEVSPLNPSAGDLVKLDVKTGETQIKQITFYVDNIVVLQGTSFSYSWSAVSGRHILSAVLETNDGRIGRDAIQVDVQDIQPPKIELFRIGTTGLKTDEFTSIDAGYYGVRLTVSDDTSVKQGGTVTVIVSADRFPNINPVSQIILVQESVSDDLKQASYVGAVSLTQGRYYLIPSGISDIYENSIENLQFLLEVR